MSVTGKDLIALGMAEGPDLARAIAEANRLNLAGAALESFARVLIGASKDAKPDHRGADQILHGEG